MVVHLTIRHRTPWLLLADLLIAAGAAAVLFSAWFIADGILYQSAQRAEFARAEEALIEYRAEAPAEEPVPEPEAPANSSVASAPALANPFSKDPQVIGLLKIARLDLEVVVREGIDYGTLRRAAGHLATSALPGTPGNVVLLGHRDTFFRPLRNLERGDVVEIQSLKGTFRYRIDAIQVVAPENVDVQRKVDGEAITLITCYPFNFIGPSPRRFVAYGRAF